MYINQLPDEFTEIWEQPQEKLNSNEESCILGVIIHQTLLHNCLDHTGMENVLPYSFIDPFVSVGYSPPVKSHINVMYTMSP